MLFKNMISEMKKEKIRKQKKERNKKIIGITAALVTTGVSGVVGGLLMAPKSGKELKEDVVKKITENNENIKKDIEEKKEKLSNSVNETRDKINSYLSAKREGKCDSSKEAEDMENKSIEKEEEAEEKTIV